MNELPDGFAAYLEPDCDRLAYLQEYLAQRSVETSVVPVNGRRHLYVNFPSSCYNPMFKIKTVIAHYDRVAGSPGANDNSAADIAVADLAVRLIRDSYRGSVHNIRIFFTDGEELGSDGVSSQGAFGLAELFRKLGIVHDDVYVFDSCGRGTVPVLARAGCDVKVKGSFQRQFADLYSRTQGLLRTVSPEYWLTLPVPYSDNAGFLACGIPAVAITLLPQDEATRYARDVTVDPSLAAAVMNCHTDAAGSPDVVTPRFRYEEKMPMTWRLFHTGYDNLLSLTPESFTIMARLLDALASAKTLA
jgi:hypothetical protein